MTYVQSFWHYYCIFFHFNPAGFLFLHFMFILVSAAMIHEWRWQYKHRDDEVVIKRIHE